MKKFYFIILTIFILTFISCESENQGDVNKVNDKKVSFKLNDKLNISNLKEVNSLVVDMDGDGVGDKIILLQQVEGDKKSFIKIIDGTNERILYLKEVDPMCTEIKAIQDTTGDGIKDILVEVENTPGKDHYGMLYTYKDGEYIISEEDVPKYEKSFLSNFSYYVMDIKSYKYFKSTIPDNKKGFYIEKGFYNKDGHPSDKSDNYTKESNGSILKDIDGDNVYELLNRFSLRDIADKDIIIEVVEIMKYNDGIFKLFDLRGDEKPIVYKDYSGLSIKDIRYKIYDYTGESESTVDYQYIESPPNTPDNIKNSYYTFYVIYDSPDGGYATDYLILVEKTSLKMYRYYPDGQIFPL